MSGETIGGHIVNSLEKAHDKITAAANTKKGAELNDAAEELEAELDRLTQLLRDA